MTKQESIAVEGTIKEALPGARFRVIINLGGREHEVLAHVSGKMRMHLLKCFLVIKLIWNYLHMI